MPAVDDLRLLGAAVDDPVRVAQFIGGLILTRGQKAALLRDFLVEVRAEITPAIREAARDFADLL